MITFSLERGVTRWSLPDERQERMCTQPTQAFEANPIPTGRNMVFCLERSSPYTLTSLRSINAIPEHLTASFLCTQRSYHKSASTSNRARNNNSSPQRGARFMPDGTGYRQFPSCPFILICLLETSNRESKGVRWSIRARVTPVITQVITRSPLTLNAHSSSHKLLVSIFYCLCYIHVQHSQYLVFKFIRFLSE